MRNKSTASLPSAKVTQSATIAITVVALALGVPASARASGGSCAAVTTAAMLQSTTPFHATYSVTATNPGAFPTEHHEEIWVGKTMYTKLADGRWMHVPVADNPMDGFTGPLDGFSDCKPLPAMAVRGETATGYDIKMESGRRAKIWISPKSGLPVHDIIDQDILLVTLDFDYASVHAPAK